MAKFWVVQAGRIFEIWQSPNVNFEAESHDTTVHLSIQQKESFMSMNISQTEGLREATMPEIEEHLAQWSVGVERLEKEIHTVKEESQKQYHEQVAVLRQQLRELQIRVQAMREGELSESKEWQESQSALHERLARLRQAFLLTAQRLHNEEKVALGWLQGFTEERSHESVGWAEGMGVPDEQSEGWAEGMGKRANDSRGWAEGYDQVKND
jgi:hypothetical protein